MVIKLAVVVQNNVVIVVVDCVSNAAVVVQIFRLHIAVQNTAISDTVQNTAVNAVVIVFINTSVIAVVDCGSKHCG